MHIEITSCQWAKCQRHLVRLFNEPRDCGSDESPDFFPEHDGVDFEDRRSSSKDALVSSFLT